MKKIIALGGLVIVGAFVFACAGGTGTIDPGAGAGTSSGSSGSNPQPQQEIVVPPALRITATFVAATLGEACGDSAESKFAPGDCAPRPDGTGCGGSCQQTNMQISFKSTGDEAGTIEIAGVSLRDDTGAEVDTLTSRNPKTWKDNQYVAWDQTVPAGAEVKASYDLSAPKWGTIDGTSQRSWSAKYRLRVHIKVNGRSMTIESPDLSREPAVVT